MTKYTSAIRQMFFSQRGNADQIPRGKQMSEQSEKWDVIDGELKEKLKNSPKLLNLYEQSIEENNFFTRYNVAILTARDFNSAYCLV